MVGDKAQSLSSEKVLYTEIGKKNHWHCHSGKNAEDAQGILIAVAIFF